MADKTLYARIKYLTQSASNWTTTNPTLLNGEVGFESDTGKLKIGDGSTMWNFLPYSKVSVVDNLTSTSTEDPLSAKQGKELRSLIAAVPGTVISVATGTGLSGGTITSSGTIKANLKSDTASTLDSSSMGSTANRQYAVGVDKSGYLSVNIPWTDTVTTVNTTGSGNAVTSITASNGLLTVDRDSTFITSHQSVVDNNPTLSWGSTSKVATIGSTDINVTMPSNPNTDKNVQSTASTANGDYPVLLNNGTSATTNTVLFKSSATINPSTGNLSITQINGVTVGNSPKFTDTVTTVSTTGSGNAVTSVSASNGALTFTKGTTFLTEHQDISGKANLDSPAFTGTPTAPTASSGTNTTQIATTAFVQAEIDAKIAAADAMIYKGTIGNSSATITTKTLPNSTAKVGWTYKAIEAGNYTVGTGSGTSTTTVACEQGDMIICLTKGSSTTYATWTVVQSNIDGAVTGPSSSVADRVAIFNGTSGKVIKDSGYTIATSVPSGAVFTDTKNTAGTANSTDTKLFLVGASSQASSSTTNSNVNCYIGTDNCLYSGGTKVLTSHQSVVNGGNTASWGNSCTVGTVGGTALTFTMPSNPDTWRPIGTGATDAAAGNHTHDTTIAASTGTNQLSLSANTKYAITAGGTSFIFTTPPDTNTWRPQPNWNATSGDAVILNKPTLATVATSGSYNDLSNKPTIPAAQVQTDWNATSGMGVLLNKPTLATVATSGSYNDLSNKPNVPTISASTANSAYDLALVNSSNIVYGNTSGKKVTFNPSTGLLTSYNYATNYGDLAEDIECQEEFVPEPGYCYSFDGSSYYKTNTYADEQFIGIHSDTAGYVLRNNENSNKLRVALSGFVLAHVDKEYKPGTPLTCWKDGILTEASSIIRSNSPDLVIAKYWRPESSEMWEEVPVNGRHWVKVLN